MLDGGIVLPDSIRSAIEVALAIGIAKPTVAEVCPEEAAVSIPTTSPLLS